MQLSPTFTAAIVATAAAFHGTALAGDQGDKSFDAEVQKYLARYSARYQVLNTAMEEARFAAATNPDPRDPELRERRIATELALTEFMGSVENIGLSRSYLQRENELSVVTRRELARIAFLAVRAPASVPDLVGKRVAEDVTASDTLHGFAFELNKAPVERAVLAHTLRTSADIAERRAAWDTLQAAGREIRPLLVRLRWLRNECVRALGKHDYFTYMASEYGMTTVELVRRAEDILRELRPLRTELHTWARYELARRYALPVPDLIPAHWLPDPAGRDWSGIVSTSDASIDAELAHDTAREIVDRAERFNASLGFTALAPEFYGNSSFALADVDSGLEFGAHPHVQHVDLQHDVRSVLELEPNERGLAVALRALGLAHCKESYAAAGVPLVLRCSPNRALEMAIGEWTEHAALQPRSAKLLGLPARSADVDPMLTLLAEGLRYVEQVSWSAGTLLQFENELYRGDLTPERWNQTWWQLAAQYQGIAPPAPRDERWCDPAATLEIVDEAGRGYDHAFSCVLMFQLHDHIARKILDADPHDASAFGHKDVGDFVRSLVRFGSTVEWRAKLREKTGFDMSVRPMVEYFEPLRLWLVEQNEGRRRTLVFAQN